MKYEVVPAEKSTVKVTMTFTQEEWRAANDEAYRQNKHKYSVNGFRKGKAPRYILEMYYGKGLFYEEALNILFREHYSAVLEGEKDNFVAVAEPTLSLAEDFSEENVSLVAQIPIKPEVTIGAYKGIKIPKYEYTVTDEDVEKEQKRVLMEEAEDVEVTDRAAELGDLANIDFVGKVDGEAFEGGSAEGFDLALGSGQFIPGFEEKIVGMTLGETRDIDVVFPEDYQAEELKGKPAVFTVTLHKLTAKKPPELDEAYAQKHGAESVEAWKEKQKTKLVKDAERASRDRTEDAILTEIAKTAEAEIPEALIEQQEDYSVRRFEFNISKQGLRLQDYLAYIGQTEEEFKKTFEADARRTVLHQLIIDKLIEVEKIEATEEEIEAKIAEQAASVGKEPEEYKKTMDPRQREYIGSDIKVTKLFEFLMANNEMVLAEENA